LITEDVFVYLDQCYIHMAVAQNNSNSVPITELLHLKG